MPLRRSAVTCIVACLAALFAGCDRAGQSRPQPPPTAPAASPSPAAPPQAAPPAQGTATAPPATVSGGGKVVAVVFGATENDPWTGAMLAGIANACGTDPLSQGASANGLDTFGPYNVKFGGRPVELHLALCDFSSTADLTLQQQLGAAARKWVEDLHPAVVWLDSDPVQLHVGSGLDPQLPVLYSGVEVQPDVYYTEQRRVCGVPRKPSLSRAMTELLKLAPRANNVALVCDDSAQGLSRIKEIRGLEPALLKGMTFVTQQPVASWSELHQQLAGLDKGIHGVLVTAMGAHGSRLAASGKPCPADLLKGVKPPVVTLGPTSMDSAGALSLRIKPDAHARAALALLGQLLDGKQPADIPVQVPEDMELYRSER